MDPSQVQELKKWFKIYWNVGSEQPLEGDIKVHLLPDGRYLMVCPVCHTEDMSPGVAAKMTNGVFRVKEGQQRLKSVENHCREKHRRRQ